MTFDNQRKVELQFSHSQNLAVFLYVTLMNWCIKFCVHLLWRA